MKNLFFFFLMTVSVTFLACNKDDDDATPQEFITATIDGQNFEATTRLAVSDNSLGETLILINGTEASSGDAIGLNIPASTATNTPAAIDETDFALTFTDIDQNAFFTVGTLTITENDASTKTIAGTFSFTATDDDDTSNVREVTNGEFRVVYN